MDKGLMIIDVSDAQKMLDMEDGAGEVLGFLKTKAYNHEKVQSITDDFNKALKGKGDEFSPQMFTLKDQGSLKELMEYSDSIMSIFLFVFILAMSVVLWNTGLLGGLRRYKEFGIRLALGESKGSIYMTMIWEAVIVGIIGSVLGTILGFALTYYMQVVGLDISGMMEGNTAIIIPNIIRSKITPELYYIGFIPGVFAMVLGTMLAGIGIYKRETATLFKELEV